MITPLGIGRTGGETDIAALAEVGTLEGHWTARAGCLSVVSPRTEATDGQTVVRMEDQSGNDRHQNLQVGTPIYKATDGPGGTTPAVYFDGASNLRHLVNVANNRLVVAVGKWTGAATFPGLNGLACTAGNAYGVFGSTGSTRLTSAQVDLSLDTDFIGDWHVAWQASSPYTVTGFLLGIRILYWTGYLCEAAVYSTALTLQQIRQVVRFLAASWGLTLTE